MNFIRPLIHFMIGLIVSTQSFAQQEPRSAFFWNQYMHTNPAMTGAVYKHQANAQWRNQSTKVNGAPTTLWLNYAIKLDSINSGIGVSYEYDVIGMNKSHTGLLSYAYHIPIRNVFLSFGISGGLKTMRIDGTGFVFPQTPEPMFQDRQLKPVFQCDFGLALHGERWNAGLSVTQLNGATFKDSIFSFTNAPHYWFFGDYTFRLGDNWTITPRVQASTDWLKINSVLALTASWKNVWFGVTAANPFNNGVELGPMIGYDIFGKFRLGYTCEFGINTTISKLKNNATHEIILSYQLR